MRVMWKVLLCAALCITTGGCGQKYESYGVLIWEHDALPYANGDVVPILREFPKTESVEIEIGGESGEFPAWRFRLFAEESEASSYGEKYDPWRWTYAYSEKNALPIRAEAGQKSDIIYKLETNQVVKVVDRSEEKVQEGTFEDYWYEVLTEDGFGGFCFGAMLVVFEAELDPLGKAAELQSQDSILDNVMQHVWRPEYFQDMIQDGRYDLERFRTDIGLFPQPEEKRIRIVTEEDTVIFSYERIDRIGAATYAFVGTELRVEVLGTNRLVASFKEEGKLVSHVFLRLTRDVLQTIREEKERRLDRYAEFAGKELHSSAYGTLRFDDDQHFAWQDYGKLVPTVIPAETLGIGTVEFIYYLGPALAGQYHGIITFRLAGVEDDGRRSFLYRFVQGGVNLVFVRKEDIQELVLPAVGVSPLILFFEEIGE